MKPLSRRNKAGEIISYQLRYYVGRNESGKPTFETESWKPDKKYTSEKKLDQAANRAQLDYEDRKKAAKKMLNKKEYTFSQFCDVFMERHAKSPLVGLSVSTIDFYNNILDHLIPAFGEKNFAEITPSEYEVFLTSLSLPGSNKRNPKLALSRKSIRNFYAFLYELYEKAIAWKIASENPLKDVQRPALLKKEIPVLTLEEAKKVLAILEESAPLKYNVFIRMALFTGMRRGEMCGLKWDCVNFNTGIVTIKRNLIFSRSAGVVLTTPKTDKSKRMIKAQNELMQLLLSLKKEQDIAKKELKENWIVPPDGVDYVFTQTDGSTMHPNAPYAWFSRFQERNGLKKCSLHALRHTNATLLIIYGGQDIKTISGRLGHSSTSTTTETYASFLQEADAMASDALEGIFSK